MKTKVSAWICLVLVGLQVLLILGSWLVTSAMPDLPMRSLLSAEGIRWLFGHFIDNLSTDLLPSIILLTASFGAVPYSGLLHAIINIFRHKKLRYVERVGMWVVFFEIVIGIVLVFLLTGVPHAILLSVTGHLFPSSFSQSIVPIVSVMVMVCSLTFGIVSGHLNTLSEVYEAMVFGLVKTAWILPIYIFGAETLASVVFVFSLL